MIIAADATNRSIYIRIVEDASGTVPGEPKTGLLFSDLTSASYARSGAARVAITPITLASASAGHADGGFILVDDTNMPGVYRFDIPDAAIGAGVDSVVIFIVVAGGSNALALPFEIEINVAQTVWDALGADHVVSDSFGEKMKGLAPAASAVTGSPTTTIFKLNGFPATLDDEIRDQIVVFIDGANEGGARSIIDATLNGDLEVTVAPPFPQAPAVSDRAVLISVAQAQGIADAVWDEPSSGHTGKNTPGGQLDGVADTSDLHQNLSVGGTFSTTTFSTGLAEANDFWNGQVVAFTTGPNAGLSRRITDFVNTLGQVTVAPAFPLAATADDQFVILPSQTAAGIADAIFEEVLSELSAIPAATPDVKSLLMLLFHHARNKIITDANTGDTKLHNDAGTAIATAVVSDAAGIFTRNKYT